MEGYPTCVSDVHIFVHMKPFKEACSVKQKQSREHKIYLCSSASNPQGHEKHNFNSIVSLYMASGNVAGDRETKLSASNKNWFI